ncbi:MAG: hypothetical protein ACT4PT_13815 [Methanobacteriota archaeon]
MTYFVLRPCKTAAAFEAFPQKDIRFRLADAGPLLAEAGFRILRDAGVVLLVERGGCEASVFASGKLLFKTTDEALAKRTMDALVGALAVK